MSPFGGAKKPGEALPRGRSVPQLHEERGCRGASLAELLVTLTIVALGGSLATRLLIQATREMEGAEVGLRAALLLAELDDIGAAGEMERPVGPGVLIGEGGDLGPRVRFIPPEDLHPARGGSGGFFTPRSWTLEGEE